MNIIIDKETTTRFKEITSRKNKVKNFEEYLEADQIIVNTYDTLEEKLLMKIAGPELHGYGIIGRPTPPMSRPNGQKYWELDAPYIDFFTIGNGQDVTSLIEMKTTTYSKLANFRVNNDKIKRAEKEFPNAKFIYVYTFRDFKEVFVVKLNSKQRNEAIAASKVAKNFTGKCFHLPKEYDKRLEMKVIKTTPEQRQELKDLRNSARLELDNLA